MTINELRSKYIEFFKSKNHAEISGRSLIPDNDPTVLFTTAGMHPLVPYLMGQPHPEGTRLTDYQKCVRTGDIEDVGDSAHLTFFEMLGNWSLGDYFKKESIGFSYEFLTSPKWLAIPPEKLSVTVFEGEEGIPRDEESAAIWESHGIPRERIHFLPREDNWWGPAGTTGPCGPDTEIFYDTGKEKCGDNCRPGCHCGKYIEIWNNVFMQYNKTSEGNFEPLARKCVDTGMGIERTVAMLNGLKTVYETDVFVPVIKCIEELSGKQYGKETDSSATADTISMRIIADHVRTATFILGDPNGMAPGRTGAAYILRRIIRRAVRCGRKLGIDGTFLAKPAEIIIEEYKNAYPEFVEKHDFIIKQLTQEEEKFLKSLKDGEKEFAKLLPNLQKNPKKIIPGRVAFRLYDTFGFPIELTEELAKENGMTVDLDGFRAEEKKHQEESRSLSAGVFKSGLGDHSEISTKYHTATHLLHQALAQVLGDEVAQKGSNITPERMRFDFSFSRAMTKDEVQQVEDIVNEQIRRDLPVTCAEMDIEEAKKSGARALFSEKYASRVTVYSIGDFSKELCTGPHVEHTGTIGHFKITKEQSSSAGVRRIRAVIE